VTPDLSARVVERRQTFVFRDCLRCVFCAHLAGSSDVLAWSKLCTKDYSNERERIFQAKINRLTTLPVSVYESEVTEWVASLVSLQSYVKTLKKYVKSRP